MRLIPTNKARSILLRVSITTLAILVSHGAFGQSFILVSSGPQYPSPASGDMIKGETGVSLRYRIVNNSDGAVTVNNIRYVPACDSSIYANCTGAAIENVFANFSTGMGQAGTACAGFTFTFGTPGTLGAPPGVIPITSSNTVVLAAQNDVGNTCVFDFTADVIGVPNVDVDNTFPGFQTFGTGFSEVSGALLAGSGTGSTEATIDSCEIKLDKQISCDGGATGGTWQDVAGFGAAGEGSATDPTDALIQGCVARGASSLSPQQVQVRYVVSNALPTAAPVSCTTFTDKPTGGAATNISLAFPVLAQTAGSPIVITGSPFACTNASSGPDTATLSTCTCTGIRGLAGTQTVAVDSGSLLTDTATHLCADVTIDKEISCNAGTSFGDVGQVRNNEDGTISCTGPLTGNSIEAKWLGQNQGTVPLTCALADSNHVLLASSVTGISLFNGAPASIIGGPTTPVLCSTAFGGGEPNTATLTCAPNPPAGVVDQTGGLIVRDLANFACTQPGDFFPSKTCVQAAPGSTNFNIAVKVANTGSDSLLCTITDQTFAGACGPTGAAIGAPVLAPNPLTVAGNPIPAPGCDTTTGMGCVSATATGTLTSGSTICNVATVACSDNGVPLATNPKTASATCTFVTQPGNPAIKIAKFFASDTVAPGATTTVKFSVINTGTSSLTGIAFTDVLPDHFTATSPLGVTSACNGIANFTVTATTVALTGGSLAVGAHCDMVVTIQADAGVGVPPIRVCDTTSAVTSDQVSSAPAFACITIGTTVVTPTDIYQVLYFSNLSKADSYINITNTGALNGFDPAGQICVNVYTFDPSEELISCCSCLVTPDGLKSISVQQDLVTNRLTAALPDSVVVKLVANAPDPGLCNAALPQFQNLTGGALAWGTTIHQNPANVGGFGITERAFTKSQLSPTELSKLTSLCGFTQAIGSGFGICASCRLGGLGGAQK
jgi:uncharacterized repeat protein (TIGR01451 family)